MPPVPGRGGVPPENGSGGGVLGAMPQTSLNSSVEVTEVQEELVAINLR